MMWCGSFKLGVFNRRNIRTRRGLGICHIGEYVIINMVFHMIRFIPKAAMDVTNIRITISK